MSSPEHDLAVVASTRRARERRKTFVVRLSGSQFAALNRLATDLRRATGKNTSLADVVRGSVDAAERDPQLLGLM